MRPISEDAFYIYLNLGSKRTIGAVAEKMSCDKATVYRHAKAEGWDDKIDAMEREANEVSRLKLFKEVQEMNERHISMYQMLQTRALKALKEMPIRTAMDAARALDIAIRGERLARGEPTKIEEYSVEERVRLQYKRWVGEAELEEAEQLEKEATALTAEVVNAEDRI